MTTIWRKLLVLLMVAVVLMLASIYEVVRWLTQMGITDLAGRFADRYLTGGAVAVIVVLVFLLRSERRPRHWNYPPYDHPEGGPRYPYRQRPWWW